MGPFAILARLLTILAVVGLVSGAFTAPAAAGLGGVSSIAMSDGMPPCDEGAPDCGDMKSCPFMVVCVAKCPQNVPATAALTTPMAVPAVLIPEQDWRTSGLAVPPPVRPPEA